MFDLEKEKRRRKKEELKQRIRNGKATGFFF